MDVKICEECKKSFPYINGDFTEHLLKKHNLSLKDYIIKYDYDNDINNVPKCQCGYCNEPTPFYRGKFRINYHYRKHQNHEWQKEQYVKKYGIPLCKKCNSELEFYRGKPLKKCNICKFEKENKIKNKKGWNQETIKKNIKKKYNVDNISSLQEIKDKISKSNKISQQKNETKQKRIKTVKERYGVSSVMQLNSSKEKQKETMFINHGVKYALQKQNNRINSSKRITEYNANWEKNQHIKLYKNTKLYYQSSYEYHFLELCENLKILDKLKNGNTYKINENHRILTDFSLDNYEIEIKSSYVMKKQGGIEKIFQKKDIVEKAGKNYIFILDKDYNEFLSKI